MDLADIRQAIDGIDTTLLNSFIERMDIATEVAKSKIEMGKAVFDPARERSKLNNLASRAPERYEACLLYTSGKPESQGGRTGTGAGTGFSGAETETADATAENGAGKSES